MDPSTLSALITALGATTGGVLTSQADKEQKLKDYEQLALQNAITMQGNAFKNQGEGAQNAYSTMLNAYKGIL